MGFRAGENLLPVRLTPGHFCYGRYSSRRMKMIRRGGRRFSISSSSSGGRRQRRPVVAAVMIRMPSSIFMKMRQGIFDDWGLFIMQWWYFFVY
jgi:hypothetical protein